MRKLAYPIDFATLRKNHDKAVEMFMKRRPHDGSVLDIIELQGSFLCDDPGGLYDSLVIGERIGFVPNNPDKDDPYDNPILSAVRADGTDIGQIGLWASVIPNALRRRKIEIYGFVECKEFISGLLSVAVSLYCGKY